MWSETRRPEFIDEVVGHTEVKQQLSTYLSKKPYTSVVLLHGPPGIGKTTMALASVRSHNIEPIEINASQSMRSHEDVSKLIDSCRHTRTISSLIRGDQKPMCLILDEIDGSDPHAQRKLAEWMVGDERRIPVIMTCNEVPRILKNKFNVQLLRCFPPKPSDIQDLFPLDDVNALTKRFKHDIRRIFQYLQYGESDTLPSASLPTDVSPEVAHILRHKAWVDQDVVVLGIPSRASARQTGQ
jgi:ATPase family associated with various cellular activities (AAA)